MKKIKLLTIAISILFAKHVYSQEASDTLKKLQPDSIIASSTNKELNDEIKPSLDNFDTAKILNDMVTASNRLVLIANKWPDQWVANYYACYSLTVLSYIEKDDKVRDAYLDNAELYLNKAKSEYKNEYDEIYVLAAMVANARLAVKPGSRYKKYGDLFNANIDKAKQLQPANPRIYYLQGNSVYYTPKMFGGGAKKAVEYFEKAATFYQNEKKDDVYKPYWGKIQNEGMLKKCRDENK